jgi:hypothetical protein
MVVNMNARDKLGRILAGVDQYEPTRDEWFSFQPVSVQNFEPPAYLVAFLFLEIMEFKDHGEMDKVWWHTFFKYKDHVFMLRDYKFGSWSLECP